MFFVYEGRHEWACAHMQFPTYQEAERAAARMNAVIAGFWDGECRVGTEEELQDRDDCSPANNLGGFREVSSFDTAETAVEDYFRYHADRIKNRRYLSCPDAKIPKKYWTMREVRSEKSRRPSRISNTF